MKRARTGLPKNGQVQGEALHRAILESAVDYAIISTDLDGHILSWNEGARRLFGWTAEDLQGRPLNLLFTAEENRQGVLEREMAAALLHGRGDDERWLRRKDGSQFWALGLLMPLRSEGGKPIGFLKILRDRSAERAMAEALRASEDNFRSMAESIPQLAWMADASGSIYWYNQRWLEYTGASPDEMSGYDADAVWRRFHHPDHRARVVEKINRCFGSGEHWEDTFPLRGADGDYRWFLSRAVPIRDENGSVARWFGTNTDITEQIEAREALSRFSEKLEQEVAHRTEQLQRSNRELTAALVERERAEAQLRQSQKMEVVGQLTGGIAHDFNNLLTGIIGNLELIQKRIDSGRFSDLQRFTAAGLSSASRAAALAQRLLSFSRPHALATRPVDLQKLVTAMNALWLRTLGEKISLRIVTPAESYVALTDENQLENALLNLVINARDAMPDGGELEVEVGSRSVAGCGSGDLPEGDYVVVRVRDSGAGMPPDVLARAFEPFFTTKPVGRGTGLGLSMIDSFVRQSGGGIEIASHPGRGTEVVLLLPRYTGPMLLQTAEKSPTPQQASGTVLVVEDDDAVRALVAEVLDDLGYGVLQARDASMAMSLIEAPRPLDLMVTDVGLPGISGLQLAGMARLHRSDLKVLFVTGYGDHLPGATEPGTETLAKPFEIDALAAKVGAMIRNGG